LLWSVEREKGHKYKDTHEIINEKAIHAAMESTQKASQDKAAIKAILDAAKERSFLTNYTPGAYGTLKRIGLDILCRSATVGTLHLPYTRKSSCTANLL
jgi:hypothetical protein